MRLTLREYGVMREEMTSSSCSTSKRNEVKLLSNVLIALATGTFVLFLCVIARPDANLQPLSLLTIVGILSLITIVFGLGVLAGLVATPRMKAASIARRP